ncbi:galactokinase [Chondrinema litorale]|uniref:galactokinase n=1 Tax=Chondrinema litorale TaxID=2994555 RepID=UPI00254428E3|nr:galactokinase [Chondrinema litorale]UZR93237.1 galactokinase [Chondrinema litorale]
MDYQAIISQFEKLYKKEPKLFRAPGRINLIGEHTDYNNGFVLPAAIDREIVYAIAPNQSDICRVYAMDLGEEDEIYLNSLKESEKRWNNYLIGVIAVLADKGLKVSGFDCVFAGSIPIGGGLSSSAALECGLGVALNELYGLGLNKRDIAFTAQKAEHEFAGVKCGIMDQFSSMFGELGKVFRLDCQTLDIQYFPFKQEGLKILLCDTGVTHSLASSEYNKRRHECEAGVEVIKKAGYSDVKTLRDVSLEVIAEFESKMDSVVYYRCSYVVEENNRVLEACKMLEAGDMEAFGKLMYQSHEGLSKKYEVSCKELDFLVEYTLDKDNILGSRMMGGGFGGCTINIVKEEGLDEYVEKISEAYKAEIGIPLKTFITDIVDGAGIVD